jgi:hypothetical protein
MEERVPVELADIEVLDRAGAPRRLAELWSPRPTALAFVRHFG